MIADKIEKVMGHFYGNPTKKTSAKRAGWPVHRTFCYFQFAFNSFINIQQ